MGASVSRVSEADNEVARPAIIQCKVCRALADVTKKEAAELRALIPARSDRHMAAVFNRLGYTLGKSSVQNHRLAHEQG